MDTDERWVTVEVAWTEQRYTVLSIYAPAAQDEIDDDATGRARGFQCGGGRDP